MTPDPLTLAHRWQRCGCAESPEAERGPNPQCVALAALIEARDREVRADECEEIAKAVWAARAERYPLDVFPKPPPEAYLAAHEALQARATQHRGDTND